MDEQPKSDFYGPQSVGPYNNIIILLRSLVLIKPNRRKLIYTLRPEAEKKLCFESLR